jgi:L-fuculose-phosphate aldolase
MSYDNVRQKVLAVVRKAVAAGLVRASAGNFSMRTEDGHVAITPAGIKYDVLTADQIAIVDLEGRLVDGPCRASSETPMHTTILRSLPDVGAVVHTHSPYAMTFAVAGREIPNVNLELLVCGAPIPVAPWACPGSARAGEVTVDTFAERPELQAMLLRNHGLVAIGATLDQAYEYAYDAEVGAQVYYQALQLGQANLISDAQRQEVNEVYHLAPQGPRRRA